MDALHCTRRQGIDPFKHPGQSLHKCIKLYFPYYNPLTNTKMLHNYTIKLSQKGMTFAPVVSGADAGYAYICLGDKTVGKVRLQYAATVEMPPQQEKKPFWHHFFGE